MVKSKRAVSKRQNIVSTDYAKFVTQLKKKIRSAQFKAGLAVNRELIRLYWDIGREIVERQEQEGWGSGVIDRVAKDIQNEFPGIEGFSKTNMGRMRAFYLAYSISPQAVGKLEELPIFNIPWGHNIAIFEGVRELITFGAKLNGIYVGLISLEFPFPNNANIYWMAVKKEHHGQGIGCFLLKYSQTHCSNRQCKFMTVETLSPAEQDPNYIKTYAFYQRHGFEPLFELNIPMGLTLKWYIYTRNLGKYDVV